MYYKNKQLTFRGKFNRIVHFKWLIVIALTLFFVLLGTCWLQKASPLTHVRAARSQVPPTVSVYFSRATNGPLGATFPVKRAEQVLSHVTSLGVVASYAMQQLIAGPTLAELQAGYHSLTHQSLYGRSTCMGQQNFILSLDRKGVHPTLGTATVTLCRQIYSSGVGMDAGIRSEIGSTLKQFTAIKNVVILRSDGHCFGDESGADLCLR